MNGVERQARQRGPAQLPLFGAESNIDESYLGMPECSNKDCTPARRITVNFLTTSDAVAFAKTLGTQITDRTDSMWYPEQRNIEPSRFFYSGPPTPTRYPVCIPSKGRASIATTPKMLDQLGVSYTLFVEPQEQDEYISRFGSDRVCVLPFSNLGQGSIPARNYILDWSKERGASRHWVLDDNIKSMGRLNNNRRLCVYGGGIFAAMEDFVDRYENIDIAGPHHKGFVPDRGPISPLLWNTRVYSCILLNTSVPFRWRGKYNEDTDLSLRVLKAGRCTLLFRSLLMNKGSTSRGDGGKVGTRGGNSVDVYTPGNYRKDFADSLENQHPDVVKTVWKFGRYHHSVDYRPFRANRPRLKAGVVIPQCVNNYGMYLVDAKDGS